jgi:hypothetical protein
MSHNNNETNPCAICYENITEKNCVTTSCGHTFHFTCLTTNILKGTGDHSMNCPMCRNLVVDKEFEDCYVEITHDSDTDSMPSLEEVDDPHDYWSGLQLWRMNLMIRDKITIQVPLETHEDKLNGLGWMIGEFDMNTGPPPDYTPRYFARVECEVVCVIEDPLPGMAPFLVKPDDGRNRLIIQAYHPTQDEVTSITHLSELVDDAESLGGYNTEEEENNWHLQALCNEIKSEQIYDKPMDQLINLVESSFEELGCRKELYKLQTVKSIVHKITVDVVKAFKSEKKRKVENLETRMDEQVALRSNSTRNRIIRTFRI